jgi:hypothetical protein
MHKDLTTEEYLQMVMDSWSAFCKSHSPLENAIKEVLAENKRLKEKVKELKEYIVSMDKEKEKHCDSCMCKDIADFLFEAELHGNYELDTPLEEALKKQMPKEATPHIVTLDKIKIGNVNWKKNTTVYKCPNCNDYISKVYRYCYKCGQKIKWSDT